MHHQCCAAPLSGCVGTSVTLAAATFVSHHQQPRHNRATVGQSCSQLRDGKDLWGPECTLRLPNNRCGGMLLPGKTVLRFPIGTFPWQVFVRRPPPTASLRMTFVYCFDSPTGQCAPSLSMHVFELLRCFRSNVHEWVHLDTRLLVLSQAVLQIPQFVPSPTFDRHLCLVDCYAAPPTDRAFIIVVMFCTCCCRL